VKTTPTLLALVALTICGAAAIGQNRERIEFSADRTATEFIEGGVIKRYSGNVTARSEDLELRAQEAVYDSRVGITRLWGGTSLRDSVRTVWADTVVYDDRSEEATAIGNVRGIERARSFNASRVLYRRQKRIIDGYGGVTVHDDSLRSSITGLSMSFNDSTRDGYIAGMPSIIREDEKGSIITITSADTVFVLHTLRKARIWNHVKVTKDSMTAISETALYEDSLERITLLGSPAIRHIMHGTGDVDKTPIRITSEVTGDTIYVSIKNRTLSSVSVAGNAVGSAIASDSTGAVYYRSVLQSRRMRLDMNGSQISQITAEGIANSYYMHAPSTGNRLFVNTAEGDTIRFFFTDGRITNMRIRGMGGGEAMGKYLEYQPVKPDSAKTSPDSTSAAMNTKKK
jgi:hypothetical protein